MRRDPSRAELRLGPVGRGGLRAAPGSLPLPSPRSRARVVPGRGGGIALVADGAFVRPRKPVAKGARMTASALERFASLPEIAEGIGPGQERLIVAAVRHTLGDVPVILCGSRATETGRPLSDFDVLVVLAWWRTPLAIKRLRPLSVRLAADLGVPVTVNPLPERRLRCHVNLFL